jgi:HPt (histidine-containing phosphotransfer) domain-containing protein
LNHPSLRGLCREYVETLSGTPDIDYAALWVRHGYLHGMPGDGYELVKSIPEGRTARVIPGEHELAAWAHHVGAFGWMACDVPPAGILSRRGSAGVFLVFAHGRELILALNIRNEESEVDGVQSSLAELARALKEHYGSAESTQSSEPITVDVAFLEAMAMGDKTFVSQMLDLCIEQLAIGSEALFEAVAKNSGKDVAFNAHKLRSTARTAGAERLDAILSEVEGAAEFGDFVGVRSAIRGCEQAISAINKILAED